MIAIITVRTADGGKTAASIIKVTVGVLVQSLQMSHSSFYLPVVSMDKTLTVNITSENAQIMGLTWASSNISVATVSLNGKVTAKSAGTVTIKAAFANGKTIQATVSAIRTNVDLTRYYTENPVKVKMLVNDYTYTNTAFSARKQLLTKGTTVEVAEIEYSSNGYPRLNPRGISGLQKN